MKIKKHIVSFFFDYYKLVLFREMEKINFLFVVNSVGVAYLEANLMTGMHFEHKIKKLATKKKS